MAVTQYPAAATYVFGSTVETGIAVDTYEQDDMVDSFEQKNNVGEVVELVTYNPRGDCVITGESTAALPRILGLTFTFANLVLIQYAVTTGIVVVKRVHQSKSRAKNLSVRVSGTYYPLLTT
jgi:hypothetical protein